VNRTRHPRGTSPPSSTCRPARAGRYAAWSRCRRRRRATSAASPTASPRVQHPSDDVVAYANGFAALSPIAPG